jgi:hypothetical protein
LYQTVQHLFLTSPTFDEFEDWGVTTAGQPDRFCADRLHAEVTGKPYPESVRQWLSAIEASDPVLTDADLLFWEENGYVILRCTHTCPGSP